MRPVSVARRVSFASSSGGSCRFIEVSVGGTAVSVNPEQTASYVRFRQGPWRDPNSSPDGKTTQYLDLRAIFNGNQGQADDGWKGYKAAQGAKASTYRGYEAVEVRMEYTGVPSRHSVDPMAIEMWKRMGLENLEQTVRLSVHVGPYIFDAEEHAQCESRRDGPRCEKKDLPLATREMDALIDNALALEAIER